MLSVGYRRPRHITLIDNDPQLRESYTTLNQQEADWLQALNEPLEAALPYITQQVRSGHIRPMSLVLSLRFDHLMILITLHGKGSIEQQRNSPLFGHSAYTAYEILHCKLDRERLETQLA